MQTIDGYRGWHLQAEAVPSGNSIIVNVQLYFEDSYSCAWGARTYTVTGAGTTQTAAVPAMNNNGGITAGYHSFTFSGLAYSTYYSFDISYDVRATLSGSYQDTWSGTVGATTSPPPYEKATQTFTTSSKNNTTGNTSANTRNVDGSGTNTGSTPNYAGDSFTFSWSSSNGGYGKDCNPTSTATLQRDTTTIETKWSNVANASKSATTNRTISVDDMGHTLYAVMGKSWKNSSGSTQYVTQKNGHAIQSGPSLSANCTLRSTKFYTGTPSCVVWRATTFNTTTNGYGILAKSSNSSGVTGGTTVSKNKVRLGIDNSDGNVGLYFGNGAFNANWSLPTSPLNIHTQKVTVNSVSGAAQASTGYYNPRTGSSSRLSRLTSSMGTVTVASGTVDLPVIDSILPASGNGTTVIVNETQRVYTTQTSPNIVYRVNHSGNKSGFGYDAILTDNSGTYGSSYYETQNCSLVPVRTDNWNSYQAVMENTSDAFTITIPNLTTAGAQKTITMIPYITDGSGAKIWGEKTRAYVTSTPYTYYLIQKPGVPTLNEWTNTLPAIDGVRDVIHYTITSPSSFGNVKDFECGYKIRYQVGAEKEREGGYEWEYVNSPTTTNTKFNGTITEVYDRSLNTSSSASVAATSRFSYIWYAYPEFQSDFSAAKSYAIAAKDWYKPTTCSIRLTEPVTLRLNVPFILTCPSDTINGNTLIQTTTLIIDGKESSTITPPTYVTSTPNKLTGQLTISIDETRDVTPILARGVHTLKVKNEVATYFDSMEPVSNHVYFGNTTLMSNEVSFEIGEIPRKPITEEPVPSNTYAGQERTFEFKWSPNDWGCLDTEHNNWHYEYRLEGPIDSANKRGLITSDELDKNTTFWSYTFTPESPQTEGEYVFRVRQTTFLGHSDWSDETFLIQPAEEPTLSTITTSDLIGLDEWEWTLNIHPGINGTYMPLDDPSVRIKADVIKPKTNFKLYNPDSYDMVKNIIPWTTYNNLEYLFNRYASPFGDYVDNAHSLLVTYERNYTVTPRARYLDNYTNGENLFNCNDIYPLVSRTHTSVSVGSEDYITFTADAQAYDSSESLIDFYTGLSPLIPGEDYTVVVEIQSVSGDGYFKPFDVKSSTQIVSDEEKEYRLTTLKAGSKMFIPVTAKQINPDTNADYSLGTKVSAVSGKTLELTCRISIIKDTEVNENNFVYKSFDTTEGKPMIETAVFPIALPDIAVIDHSHIISCTEGSDIIPFQLYVDCFACTLEYQVWHSLDYGRTWIEVTDYEDDGRLKHFKKEIELSWTDEIWIKAHGKNDTAETDKQWVHEMPTDYLAWLSWFNKKETLPFDRIRRFFISHKGDEVRKIRHVSKH